MDEALGTLISRKAQEAEDAVLGTLSREIQAIGAEQARWLRQVFAEERKQGASLEKELSEQRALLEAQGAALSSLDKKMNSALYRLGTDLTQLGARLQEQIQEKTKALLGNHESAAAEHKKALEMIFFQTKEARSLLGSLPGVLATHEKTLAHKQDSLHQGLGDLQKELPAHFYNRDELREILDRREAAQRDLLASSIGEMRKQIRFAQLWGALAVALIALAWLIL